MTGRTGLGRAFNRVWAASVTTNVADGVVLVGSVLAASQLTRSASLVAGVRFAHSLPLVAVSLPAGALADRMDRRHLMMLANTLRAAALGALTVATLTGRLGLPLLYAVVATAGAAEAVVDSTAQTIVPSLVPPDRLASANGRMYSAQVVAKDFLGAPLAGMLVTLAVAAAFASPALLYAGAVLVLATVPGDYRAAGSGAARRLTTEIAEGVRFVAGHRVLRVLAVMVGVVNLGNVAFFSVFVLFAVGPGSAMGLSEAHYGLLLAIVAAGAVTGSSLAGVAQRAFGAVRLLKALVLGGATCFAALALTAAVGAVAVVFFVMGFLVMQASVVLVVLRQLVIPDRLLGRGNAAYRLVAWGTIPLGALLGGAVGDLVGLRAVFVTAALLQLVALACFLWLDADAVDAAEARQREA